MYIQSDTPLYRFGYTYFPTWRLGSLRRHRAYVAALEAQGVTPIMGHFKEKYVRCQATCREEYQTHEEKETDVNIGVHLVSDALCNRFDTAFIISADTDLNAAVKKARLEAQDKKISMVAPTGRFNRNHNPKPLLEITLGKLRASQLPDEVHIKDGPIVNRPDKYR